MRLQLNRRAITLEVANTIGRLRPEALDKTGQFLASIIDNDPEHLDALFSLGLIRLKQRSWAEALAFLVRAADLAPDNPDVFRLIAHAHYEMGAAHEAIAAATRGLELRPDDVELYRLVCLWFHDLGMIEAYRETLGRAERNCASGFHLQPAAPLCLEDADEARYHAHRRAVADPAGTSETGRPAVATWGGGQVGANAAELRGATANLGAEVPVAFLLAAADGADGEPVTIAAQPVGDVGGGVVHWQAKASGLVPGVRYRYRLIAGAGADRVEGDEREFLVRRDAPPEVTTGTAIPIGWTELTVNGTVGGSTVPTRYWFRYGATADALDRETPPAWVPPARGGRLRDSAVNVHRRLLPFASEAHYLEPATPEAAADDVVMRLETPFGKDRHHLDGIGVVDLMMTWTVRPPDCPDAGAAPRPPHAGEVIDLRGAEVTLRVRPMGLDPKDFRLVAWIHGGDRRDRTPKPRGLAPWALSGEAIAVGDLADGQWHDLRFVLRDDSEAWTFAGTNVEEMPWTPELYVYRSLTDSLAVDPYNIAFCLVFGRDTATPVGAMDVSSAALRHRDWSLLAAGGSARLIHWPAGSLSDPGHLTGGWVEEDAHCWLSVRSPQAPQTFVWDLGEEATMDAILIHQHPRWPAREVSVAAGVDEDGLTEVWRADLGGDGSDHGGRACHHFDPPVRLRYLRLAIHSGVHAEHWGLDAVRVFGAGGGPVPEADPCPVSCDIEGLAARGTVHYQLVAENREGRTEGEVRSARLPADAAPRLYGARLLDQGDGRATFLVRMTAMGDPTTLSARFEDEGGQRVVGPAVAAGRLQTPRHLTYVADGFAPGTRYRATFTATNAAGESAPLTVDWASGPR